jgi:acetyltransferase-like isoleucine patch superfamily enzyme
MFKKINRVGDLIGRIFSYLLSQKFFLVKDFFFNSIYSGWIKRFFNSAGNDFFIQYPLNHVGLQYISIGNGFNCFPRLRLEAHSEHLDNHYTPTITIGNNVSINFDCHIACVNRIVIGNNVLIASKVFITDHFHGEVNAEALQTPPSARKVISKGPVIIHDNVWIGEGVCILPDITVGENSIIGANAVVTKSFPKNSVIGGNPAKLIRSI